MTTKRMLACAAVATLAVAAFAGHAFAVPFSTTLSSDAMLRCAFPAPSCMTAGLSGPQSASQAGTLNSMAVHSAVAIPGVAASQNVTASFTSANEGLFTYDDRWDIAAAANVAIALMPPQSSYIFAMTTPGSIDVSWSFLRTANLESSMQCCAMWIDGVVVPLPIAGDASASGIFSVQLPLTTDFTYVAGLPLALGPGTHLLQFRDGSNVFGGGSATPHIVEEELASFAYTIHGTISGDALLPEPPTFALVAIGLFFVAAVRTRAAH